MTVLVWGVLQPVFVHAETRVIPSAAASGRYDSNIFFAPASLLPPGQKTSDYVATVGGGMQLLHNSRAVEASLTAGADVNGYAINKELNYVTTRVDGYAILNRWVENLAEGAKLQVSERFRYTPESPGFLTGGGVAPTADDPFLRGVQGFRANTYSTTTTVDGSYPLLRRLALQGSYTFALFKVGSILTATASKGIHFFDSTVNTWSAGPQYQLTPEDSIGLSFQQRLVDQTSSAGGTPFLTNMQSVWAKYTRVLPDWRFKLEGGGTLVEPASSMYPTGSIGISTNPERPTTVEFRLSRLATPSFFITAGAIISNVGQVLITHQLSRQLSLQGNVSYAYNEAIPKAVNTHYTNTTAVVNLNYKMTKSMDLDLFSTYSNFTTDAPTINYQIPRNVVGFTLTVQWK